VNNIMLTPRNNGSPLDKNVHWDSGLLIDYDYSFLYANAAAKLMEIHLRDAKEHQHEPTVSPDIIPPDVQLTDNANELLLHRTVSIYRLSTDHIIDNGITGNIPIHVHPTFDSRRCKNRAFGEARSGVILLGSSLHLHHV